MQASAKSVGSDGQVIAIYEDDVKMGHDVEMKEVDSEIEGANIHGDWDSSVKDDSEVGIDENSDVASYAEEINNDEEGLDGTDAQDEHELEMHCVTGHGVMSSEGDDPGEDWSYCDDDPLITADGSQIFEPDIMSYIPMPTNSAEIKKALLDIFLFCAPLDYLINGCRIDIDIIDSRFPNNIWWSMFTRDETLIIVAEREKWFLRGILDRISSVMARWEKSPGYPAVPESRVEIELAKTKAHSVERKAYFELILAQDNVQADEWIMTISEVFRPATGFDGLALGDIGFSRESWASFAATLAEARFSQTAIARAELKAAEHESIESLIADLLLVRASRESEAALACLQSGLTRLQYQRR